jgi:hypothetical protein
MKQLKFLILIKVILFLSSCGSIKEGFKNQKKNSTDEFLVEKKSPLVMPPDYNVLPIPKQKSLDKKVEDNIIESLISKKNVKIIEDVNTKSQSLEEQILKKIKSN